MTAVRWTMRWAGALLLAAIAVVHGRLWLDGYRSIDLIGPLFALDVVLAALLAVAVLLAPDRYLTVVALAGALLAVGTAGGLLLSTQVPVFGFQESLAAQHAVLSLLLEGAAGIVLVALAGFSARHPARPPAHRGTRSGTRPGARTSAR
jgi:hypothetical protein